MSVRIRLSNHLRQEVIDRLHSGLRQRAGAIGAAYPCTAGRGQGQASRPISHNAYARMDVISSTTECGSSGWQAQIVSASSANTVKHPAYFVAVAPLCRILLVFHQHLPTIDDSWLQYGARSATN